MTAGAARDHLFINYATEDSVFADWLVRKLMSEGYKVWYDRLKLLGGESYPTNIDAAIKDQSFRLLALLSAASLRKPDPTKERTLALNISKERNIDFLIPLLVEPLRPTELDWRTSDLTYIAFHGNWAGGFTALLEKLRSVCTPCDPHYTRQAISSWSAMQDRPAERGEKLWTNLLPLLEIPEALRGFRLTGDVNRDALALRWPHYCHRDLYWAFEAPHPELGVGHAKPTEIQWPSLFEYSGMKVPDVVFYLVRRALITHCIQKGARPDPTHSAQIYFPQGLLPADRLWYQGYSGRQTYVNLVGERTFSSHGEPVKNRYHLAVRFTPALRRYGQPVVQIHIHLHLTDQHGRDLDARTAFRRQNRIRRNWWNHQWLCRLLAVSPWMAGAEDSFNALHGGAARLIVAQRPLQLSTSQGIDEDALAPLCDEEDDTVPEDEERVESEQ